MLLLATLSHVVAGDGDVVSFVGQDRIVVGQVHGTDQGRAMSNVSGLED